MPSLQHHLDVLLRSQDAMARRQSDPVAFVHAAAPEDRELVGLLASSLAFGNVKAIAKSIERALGMLKEPLHLAARRSEATLRRRLQGFVHRVYTGDDVARMLHRAGLLCRDHGCLGAFFRGLLEEAQKDDRNTAFRIALAAFAASLRGPNPGRGLRHLIPDPAAGSACKRLLLYLRWMIRPKGEVDFGLWPVPPSVLLIPLDTHVFRIAGNLGLTTKRQANWAASEEVTAALRRFDPEDPTKYDFALCHLGVSRDCPSRPDPEKCGQCVLRPACRQWANLPSAAT